MNSDKYKVKGWGGENLPGEEVILQMIAAEGLSGYRWSNLPGDVYAPHNHAFDKIIFVLQGSITFGLHSDEIQLLLKAGDRLDLTQDTVHDAVVGPQGVVCLEVHHQS